MEFCDFCNNMLYVCHNEDDAFEVKHYCKNCSFTKSLSQDKHTVLLMKNRYNVESNWKQYANPDIEFDPTIPRVDNIPCPNAKCTAKTSDVMYMKYDAVNIRYVYFCVHCKHFWRNEPGLDDDRRATE